MTIAFRITRILTLVVATFGLLCVAPAGAAEIAGVKLDERARVANQDLKLNGAGIRYKAIFKVYVVGLYLPETKSTVPEVLAAPGARRTTIVMLRDVSNEEFGRGFMSGIQQNIERAEKVKYVQQLLKFGEMFASVPELKKGDVLTVDWLPSSGTVIHLNGKMVADSIPELGFYNVILRIWLGEKPLDDKLKQLLLGGRPDDGPRNIN